MSVESKDEEKDIYRDGGSSPDQEALLEAFIDICNPQTSDHQAITLNDFICGLIQFGINDLSNKQMEQIFNFMDHDNTKTINQDKFIKFLSIKPLSNKENDDPNLETNIKDNINDTFEQHKLQMILLNEIIDISTKQQYQRNYKNGQGFMIDHPPKSTKVRDHQQQTLEQSDYYEFSYTPSKPAIIIFREYEEQIMKLKGQLKEAISTLKETVNNNAVHIGEHQQVITQLKYSLLKQKEEETAAEVLIQSSLEPQTDYNPLEWNINDVIDWLEMINLKKYIPSFRLHKINGNKLLNTVYNFGTKQFTDILKFQSQQDIDKFLHEINILKQTAPQIYDPHNIELSPSISSSISDSESAESYHRDEDIDGDDIESGSDDEIFEEYVVEQVEYYDEIELANMRQNKSRDERRIVELKEDDEVNDISITLMINLEETDNVTRHSFLPNIADTSSTSAKDVVELRRTVSRQKVMISQQKNELDNIRDIEIDKLKAEIQRIELSKLELIISTSNEIQKLRDMLKQYR